VFVDEDCDARFIPGLSSINLLAGPKLEACSQRFVGLAMECLAPVLNMIINPVSEAST